MLVDRRSCQRPPTGSGGACRWWRLTGQEASERTKVEFRLAVAVTKTHLSLHWTPAKQGEVKGIFNLPIMYLHLNLILPTPSKIRVGLSSDKVVTADAFRLPPFSV